MKPGAYATVPAGMFRWLGTGNKGMFPNRRFCYLDFGEVDPPEKR